MPQVYLRQPILYLPGAGHCLLRESSGSGLSEGCGVRKTQQRRVAEGGCLRERSPCLVLGRRPLLWVHSRLYSCIAFGCLFGTAPLVQITLSVH